MTEIRRLAIVNRAEPALRALDAIAELNREGSWPSITSIVLYTDPDAAAWFVRQADEAICLGPATFVDPADGARKSSYLDEQRVVESLVAAHVDAVWVGWGFVAEHASFAQLCEKEGIVFVGPDSDTIRRLGDKIAAKKLAEQVDVPVVPWSNGALETVEQAREVADRLGYPVLLKAASGGGGRGIRLVESADHLASAFESARAEAALAFGDDSVFAEQFVAAARHVEVQIIADGHGGTWAVGVRDCSVQRRHQKVLEESVSTVLDAAAEARIKAAAVRLADAAGYRNAGTVEFLVDPATGRFTFMEVNTRLQVEHPVTEQTTGVDLVKLQLHVARGGRIVGEPPATRGVAIEARLCAEDPAQGFAPAPGRIVLWRPPAGPGIRVDSGVTEGDVVAPEFDSLIAKIIAWGHDRDEAIVRLQRALARSAVVIEGGTTNRSFLLALLDHPDLRAGNIDNHWLDRLTASGGYAPAADPFALVMAAIEAYSIDEHAVRETFHAGARRGRPELPDEIGHEVRLRYRFTPYTLHVYRTAPDGYDVRYGDQTVSVRVDWLGPYERRAVVGARNYRVVTTAQRTSFLIDLDGAVHRVHRDDGGVVRSGWPAFVISVDVERGQTVEEDDPILVLESMKMETVVTAPFSGEITEVFIAPKTQVDAAAPLVRIQERSDNASMTGKSKAVAVDLSALAGTGTAQAPLQALHSYLLGFDLDPDTVRSAIAAQRRPGTENTESAEDEERLLDLFADVAALYRSQPAVEEQTSAQEYLLSFLQWLDVERAGLPEEFQAELTRMLARYGVSGTQNSPELERAVVWMWRSFSRADEVAPAVAAILDRRLRSSTKAVDGTTRTLLSRLAVAAQARYADVADLSRDLLFHYFDEPLLERVVADVYAEMARHLDVLAADPNCADRDERVRRLIWCPQPMRGVLRAQWAGASPALREVLLEVYLGRYYRTRALHDLRFVRRDDALIATADYEFEDRRIHLVSGFAPDEDLEAWLSNVRDYLRGADEQRGLVLDIVTWRAASPESTDALAASLTELLDSVGFDRRLHRVDFTVTHGGREAEHARTSHVTFRHGADGFAEQTQYRNLHPMLAKRMELWRLSNFELTRLRSVEDVYLFRGVAFDNPSDVRLFALAEVRDLTPVRDARDRIVALPLLERMGLQAIAAMRATLADMPAKTRPRNNRIVLYVRPPLDVPRDEWGRLAVPYQRLAASAGLQKIVLRVRVPDEDGTGPTDQVLEFSGAGGDGIRTRLRPADAEPISSLTAYHQKVQRAARMGTPYPYELLHKLTPAEGIASEFPPGVFVEHDLDAEGRLVAVERPPGENKASIVVGLITHYTERIPEGMTRVAILGDPTRALGALAEPECRRIMAGLDLAEQLGVPAEWYALSAGAKIAMDSGVENMDWIGAVLRRIIEYTQAGSEINIVVTGINVGAQPYWNAEATMLMHTKGILVMTPASAMVLTGKQALDYSGGVSAEDNFGIGGFERVMGPNGQGQYWAPTLPDACQVLMRHYEHSYVVPGERYPRRWQTADPYDRDVCSAPHSTAANPELETLGDVFSEELNGERKKPFDIRSVMRAVADTDAEPLERWARWRGAESSVIWDARVGGIPVSVIGIEGRALARRGYLPADGPSTWTSGTLFPQSSRKIARAVNAASGNRPLVVLANLSGFDGSPESMRRWQLEYGAEIGRAVTNFRGPIIFVVVSRYHGGAFVVFSKQLNESIEAAAVEGSYASVIGGAPAAGVVFVRDVENRTDADPRVAALREELAAGSGDGVRAKLREVRAAVRAEKLGEVAAEFDAIHNIQRAQAMGSVDRIIPAAQLRPYLIDALERGMAKYA
jgi:acetyl/propionyl-CoA carboxylase alpha subunit/acetyl-CoA carboxylase carboxyltransferase component